MSDFAGMKVRKMARNGTLDGDAGDDYLDEIADANGGAHTGFDSGVNRLVGFLGKVLLCVLFAPIVVFVLGFYLLWRQVRLRPSFLAVIGAVMILVGLVFGVSLDIPGRFADMMANHPDSLSGVGAWLGHYSGLYIGIMFSLGLVFGPPIAAVFISLQLRMLKHAPWLTTTEGEDYYGFMYRLTPLEILRKNKTIREIKSGDYSPNNDDRLTPLGMEDEPMDPPANPSKVKRYQVVSRSLSEATMHTLITGSTGAGKSKTMLSIILRDIKAGRTVVIIDNKNSPDFACSIAHMAKQYGRKFMHFSVSDPYPVLENEDGPCAYDPLSTGSVAKKTDMVLGMREWDTSSAVYREQSQSYLSIVFATLDEARRLGVLDNIPGLDTSKGELYTFVQALDRNVFNAIVIAMNKYPQATGIRKQASDLNAKLTMRGRGTPEAQGMQHAQTEYQSVFSGLMATYGSNLVSDGSMDIINIMDATSEPNNVILFSLDASKQGDRGAELGAMICQDLTNMSETRPARGVTNPISVYIDEFQSLPPTCVSSMLQKARASKVGLTLAFQSLDQVIAATDGKDAYVKGLLDTCSNFIFHSGSNMDTGELAAKIIGKRKVTNYIVPRMSSKPWTWWLWTKAKNQIATKSTDEEYILDPSEFQQLSIPSAENGFKSEAIIIKKISSDPIDKGHIGASAHKVQIIPPKEVLEDFYDPVEFSRIIGEQASATIPGSDVIDAPDLTDDIAPTARNADSADSERTVNDEYTVSNASSVDNGHSGRGVSSGTRGIPRAVDEPHSRRIPRDDGSGGRVPRARDNGEANGNPRPSRVPSSRGAGDGRGERSANNARKRASGRTVNNEYSADSVDSVDSGFPAPVGSGGHVRLTGEGRNGRSASSASAQRRRVNRAGSGAQQRSSDDMRPSTQSRQRPSARGEASEPRRGSANGDSRSTNGSAQRRRPVNSGNGSRRDSGAARRRTDAAGARSGERPTGERAGQRSSGRNGVSSGGSASANRNRQQSASRSRSGAQSAAQSRASSSAARRRTQTGAASANNARSTASASTRSTGAQRSPQRSSGTRTQNNNTSSSSQQRATRGNRSAATQNTRSQRIPRASSDTAGTTGTSRPRIPRA